MVCTKLGKVELARGGTLYLKEVGVLSKFVQEKLLRLLQERQFARIGSDSLQKADFRLFVSSTSNLQAAVLNGSFLEELSVGGQFRPSPRCGIALTTSLCWSLFVQQFNQNLETVNKVTSGRCRGWRSATAGKHRELALLKRPWFYRERAGYPFSTIGKVGDRWRRPDNNAPGKMEQVLLKQALTRWETLEGQRRPSLGILWRCTTS